MRLQPIDHPRSILLRVAYFFSKRQFGTVLAALRFIYARSVPIMMASLKIVSTEKKLHLPQQTRILIRYFTSHLNECPFCSNLIEYAAQKESVALQQLKEVLNFRNSQHFNEKEKSLLTYLEEVNLTRNVSDDTFQNLKRHFSETEIVEITWINATENYFNFMAKPLGLRSDQLQYKSAKMEPLKEKRTGPLV